MKTAIITGVTGQDGSYLAELLLDRGYRVYGTHHRLFEWGEAGHLRGRTNFESARLDVTDARQVTELIAIVKPDEVYNLAAISSVTESFNAPIASLECTGVGALNCLAAILKHSPTTRFFQSSSSEMFGGIRPPETGYDEESAMHPRSPYGIAKQVAHWFTVHYRERYGLFACAGIMFNHESPRRGQRFVSRKIAMGVAAIAVGKASHITLGNLEARRDWGYAPEYVSAMHAMLQQPSPTDYVIASGESRSIADFCETAFFRVGILDWRKYINTDPSLLRPTEVYATIGNPSKANCFLGWRPTITFEQIVHQMVDHELEQANKS